MIKHHLTDALLMAYSAGSPPEAFSLILAAHVSMCDECRARLAAFDTVGGALIDTGEAAEMEQGSLAATLTRIKARGSDDTGPDAPRRSVSQQSARPFVLPAPVRDYVGGDVDAVRWRPVGGGVRQAILPTSRAASARLLYIPGGVAVPDHGHRGTELTLVLQGAFSDESDRFARGDVEVADENVQHTPVAEKGEDCICLAATDAPLRFRGLIPRIAQPFLRI